MTKLKSDVETKLKGSAEQDTNFWVIIGLIESFGLAPMGLEYISIFCPQSFYLS